MYSLFEASRFSNLKFRKVFEILRINRPIYVSDSIGDSLGARITPAISGPSLSPSQAIHIERDKTRNRLSDGKSKKVLSFFFALARVSILSIPESATPRTRPNIWYMGRRDPSGSRDPRVSYCFTRTLGFYLSLPRRPPLPATFFSFLLVGDGKSPRFSWISRNHELRKVAEHVDRAPRCRVC